MTVPTTRRPLLAHLAQLGWFLQMGEPAATQAVHVLLREKSLKQATLRLVRDRTGVDLSDVERFVAEAVGLDRARPDLEGLTSQAEPLLVVEMKFGARLGPGQLLAYLRSQRVRLDPERDRVLVVLVPDRRRLEAERVLGNVNATWGVEAPAEASRTRTTVVTWPELLDAWDAVTSGEADLVAVNADVVQLRGLCEALTGFVIEPFDLELASGGWLARLDDLRKLSDAVTRAFGDVNPTADETKLGYVSRRYFLAGGPSSRTSLAVGVQARFAEQGMTPLWARLHRKTPGFEAARSLISASPLGSAAREDHGHLWLPLLLEPHLPGSAQVEPLVAQVEAILSVLRSSSPSH